MRKRTPTSRFWTPTQHRTTYGVALALIGLPLAFLVTASAAASKTQDTSETSVEKEIPLVTEDRLDRMIAERKAELERRRKTLVDAIDDLGSKHPSIAGLETERDELDDQIAIWSLPKDQLLSVADRDLRVLVLQLRIRVDQLEAQNRDQQYLIQRGQTNQNVFHSSGPGSRGPGSRGPGSRGQSPGGSRPPGPPRPR